MVLTGPGTTSVDGVGTVRIMYRQYLSMFGFVKILTQVDHEMRMEVEGEKLKVRSRA
jgi:hypothetical protein